MTYGFNKGLSQLKVCEVPDVKAEIMAVLGITTNVSWISRRSGKVEPKISEARAIEEIFAKRGITDVWG